MRYEMSPKKMSMMLCDSPKAEMIALSSISFTDRKSVV